MTKLLDLNDYCLLEILDRLSPEQLFKVLRLNKRFYQLASEKIKVKIKAIALTESDGEFNDCHHLKPISRNQVLVLWPMFRHQFLQNSTKRAQFLRLLAKCSGVKSIDFNYCHLDCDIITTVVRCCPELECLKLKSWIQHLITDDDWMRLFNKIGEQIVHFTKWRNSYSDERDEMLTRVAVKCPNIRRVDYYIDKTPDKYLLDGLKMLKSSMNGCRVKLDCEDFNRSKIKTMFFRDEVVDELVIDTMDWSLFGKQINRLSSLEMIKIINERQPKGGVDFFRLKKFKLIYRLGSSLENDSIDFLSASRFPVLEEFGFVINANFNKNSYRKLFQKMQSVKKLSIYWDWPKNEVNFTETAPFFNHLMNLEVIYLDFIDYFDFIREDQAKRCFRNLKGFLNQISVKIISLKKLTIKMKSIEVGDWTEMLADEIKQMKVANRFKVDMVFKNYYHYYM